MNIKNAFIFFTFLSLFKVSNAQYCISDRFDIPYFAASQIDSVMDQKYGQAYNWQDTLIQKLKLDVYFPNASADPLAKRPLIVMIHSGGFYTGGRGHYRYYCREFAKRGFVAATIDYRLGWDFGLGKHYETYPASYLKSYPFNCEGDSLSSIKALYRALQDQKAAIRFLVHYADTLRIDTDYIFVGGGSAGAVSSLGLQYFQQNFFDTEFADLNLKDSLGLLDSATNSLTESFSLAGIISMWGAVPDTSLITAANSLPTLLIHCTGDSLVPCISDNFFSCPNYVNAQGSCIISQRLEQLNECYEFNYYDAPFPLNGCHNVYPRDYHIERISKFIKRLLCDDCRQITIENQVEVSNDSVLASVISNHLNNESRINIYPNPVTFQLNIFSKSTINKITIYNYLGQTVKTMHPQNNAVDLTTDNLATGIYFLKIETSDRKIAIKKIMVNKL